MLPVSGAEQLNTSGAMRRASHDFAEGRVFEIRQAGAVFAFRQKQIPEAVGEPSASGLDDAVGCQRSPAAICS